jgi:hypothetical protein
MEPPPGGPPDAAPPQLIRTSPDSFATLSDFGDEVEFVFDEVISEGGSPNQGTGTGDLERLIILSPTREVPTVRWRRNRITVRPDEGWQPDRVYRVELLPGVTDLHRNRLSQGALVTFSTGAPRPQTTFEGTVMDWRSGRPAPAALIVATQLPDSLPYRGLADSSGSFRLGPLPAGEYIVSGVLDENRNNLADSREAFDSVRVSRGRDSTVELWAFVHDTSPPRIRAVTSTDSMSATVELTQSLDPRQRLLPSAVRVSLLPDSTPVPITSLLPRPVDDSLHAKRAPVDSAKADTAAVPPKPAPRQQPTPRPPTPRQPPVARPPAAQPGARPGAAERRAGRPPLTDQLVLRPARPWRPDTRYFVEIRGVRNVTGVAGDVVGTLVIPERPPRDTLAAPADSLRPGADTTRAAPDSVPKAPARPAPSKPAPRKPTPARP